MKWSNIILVIAVFCFSPGKAQQINFNNANIVSFDPVVLTEGACYGSGLSWEHFLAKEGWLSFILPVAGTVSTDYSDIGSSRMFYFTPGIKMYTNMTSYRNAKFSIGPSLVLGTGRGYRDEYTGTGRGVVNYDQKRVVYGFMVVAGLNWFPFSRIYLGLDYGLGITELDSYDGVNRDPGVLSRLSFKIGYRFRNIPAVVSAQ